MVAPLLIDVENLSDAYELLSNTLSAAYELLSNSNTLSDAYELLSVSRCLWITVNKLSDTYELFVMTCVGLLYREYKIRYEVLWPAELYWMQPVSPL